MADNPSAEFIVLNYNSPDNLDSWIVQHLSRRLRYVRMRTASAFHFAHAKNLAAKATRHDILVSLDADTFAGRGLESRIVELFSEDPERLVQVGRGGTVALLRDDFFRLRGYDESMQGWGYEDVDLIARAGRAGLPRYRLRRRRFESRIEHTDEERERFAGVSMNESRRKNYRIYCQNRRARMTCANTETWGMADVEVVESPEQ